MFEEPGKISIILGLLKNSPHETVGLFKSQYVKLFDVLQVPAVEDHGQTVVVNRLQALEFLKKTYRFLDKQDLTEELKDAARDNV